MFGADLGWGRRRRIFPTLTIISGFLKAISNISVTLKVLSDFPKAPPCHTAPRRPPPHHLY